VVVDEWDGWLGWDDMIEVLPSFDSRRQSTGSSFYESDPNVVNMIKDPESIFSDRIPEDGAPSKLDNSSISPSFPFSTFSFLCNDESRSIKLRDQPMVNPGRPLHAYSTLSATEERRLREIAMPDHIMAAIASNIEQDMEINTEVKRKPRGTKRKSSTSTEDRADTCQYRKQSHNTIEKRYRVKLNEKIDILRQSIPEFHDMPSQIMEDGREEGGTTHKLGKAAILTGAVEYITRSESCTVRLRIETAALKARLEAFEKLAVCGLIFSGEDLCSNSRIP
jgi:hypothetical protein